MNVCVCVYGSVDGDVTGGGKGKKDKERTVLLGGLGVSSRHDSWAVILRTIFSKPISRTPLFVRNIA